MKEESKSKFSKNSENKYTGKGKSRRKPNKSWSGSGSSSNNRSYIGDAHCGKNDVEMHLKVNLMTDASNINFSLPQGMSHELVKGATRLSIPSVCSIGMLPAFGKSANMQDPINKLAMQMQAYMRSKGKISQPYDQNDVLIQLCAEGQYLAYISWLKRIVKYGYTYDRENYYIPEALAQADNVDQADIALHRDDLEMYINECIAKAGIFNIPAGLDFIELPIRYLNGIYCDDTGTRRQFYMFVPEMFMGFRLDDNAAGSVSEAYPVRSRGNVLRYDDIHLMGEQLWEDLYTDETYFAVINGDIGNAFDNLYKIPSFTPGEWVPIYDEADVISQIRNARLFGTLKSDLTSYGLYQDPLRNCVYCTPKLDPLTSVTVSSTAISRLNALLTAPVQTVYAAPGQNDTGIRFVMEASRFMPVAKITSAETGIEFDSTGLIILTTMKIWWYTELVDGTVNLNNLTLCSYLYTVDPYLYRKIGIVSTFTNHPPIWIINAAGTGTGIEHFNVIESIMDKVGYLPQQTLAKVPASTFTKNPSGELEVYLELDGTPFGN